MKYKCLTYLECTKGTWKEGMQQKIVAVDEPYDIPLDNSTEATYIKLLLPEYISVDGETYDEFQTRMMQFLGQRLKYGAVLKNTQL